jgi:PAS domain S-box-containing protein
VPYEFTPLLTVLCALLACFFFICALALARSNKRLRSEMTLRDKKANQNRLSEERLNVLFEYAPDAYYLSDLRGTFLDGNKKAEEMIGYRKEELVGRSFLALKLLSTRDLVRAGVLLAKNCLGLSTGPDDFILNRMDGKKVPVEIRTYPVRLNEKIVVLGIARDITARKETEKVLVDAATQLIQSERLSSLGELMAGIAHELNQPLNGIKIISQSLLIDLKKDRFHVEQLNEDLSSIIHEVDNMADLIDHMRDFTRRDNSLLLKEVNVNDIIHDTLKFIRQQLKNHNIRLSLELSDDLLRVKGNPLKIEQVILNLLTNARHAVENMEKKDKVITIRTFNQEKKTGIGIAIEDNGIGMKREIREKIFQPFFTTKDLNHGTGLGLSVSKKLVEEHKGQIEFESEYLKGTVFRIFLPLHPDSSVQAEIPVTNQGD